MKKRYNMSKAKMPLLWAILIAMVFFACGDRVVDPFDGYDGYDDGDIRYYGVIVNAKFVKVGQIPRPDLNTYLLTEQEINEYRVGDTLAIHCVISISLNSYGEYKTMLQSPGVYQTGYISPIARIMSHKTGDVQYVSFVGDPITTSQFGTPIFEIAYISPVKLKDEPTFQYGQLIPDPKKKQLKIDPKGDILIAYIKYKYQILTIIIPVKGD
jgi:hypothetical protein